LELDSPVVEEKSMRRMILALCAVSGACAGEPSAVAATSGTDARRCGLTVRFGSYAMGIDTGSAQQVEALLRADRAVRGVERRPWGKEGEVDLCAQVAPADACRLASQIRTLLPPRPRGPITVLLADGTQYQVPKD
jgi:hypothetical protein